MGSIFVLILSIIFNIFVFHTPNVVTAEECILKPDECDSQSLNLFECSAGANCHPSEIKFRWRMYTDTNSNRFLIMFSNKDTNYFGVPDMKEVSDDYLDCDGAGNMRKKNSCMINKGLIESSHPIWDPEIRAGCIQKSDIDTVASCFVDKRIYDRVLLFYRR